MITPPLPGKRPVVLLIDDDADTLDMYEVGLSVVGFRPFVTRDASSVSRQVDAIQPAIVVTDLRLRGTSGWSVLEVLNLREQRIPVVLLTGDPDPLIDQRAQELGCAAVVMKPCPADELGQVLTQVLAAR
jgi:DNA-binding NtrC family response regulator